MPAQSLTVLHPEGETDVTLVQVFAPAVVRTCRDLAGPAVVRGGRGAEEAGRSCHHDCVTTTTTQHTYTDPGNTRDVPAFS